MSTGAGTGTPDGTPAVGFVALPIAAEYATLTGLRTQYLGTTATGQDALLLQLIRATAREAESMAGDRRFYPRVETRYYDHPMDRQLDLDDDLLAVTTFTNGDGTTIAASEYDLLPYVETPYYAIRMKASSTIYWQYDSSSNSERVLPLAGIWGWHKHYAIAWPTTGATLAAAITSATATTFTCTTGLLVAGDLIKIDSEYMYVSNVATDTVDTATVIRGVHGSTAATHLISSIIYRWWQPEIAQVVTEAVVAKFRLKNNPVGETVQVGDATFATPKDVNVFMRKRLEGIGAVRIY